MDTRSRPRGNGINWIVWLTAALLTAWVVLGFIGGWQLHHLLGVATTALLLTAFFRQMRHVRRSDQQAELRRSYPSTPAGEPDNGMAP